MGECEESDVFSVKCQRREIVGVNIGDKGGVGEKLRRGTDGRRARVSVEVERGRLNNAAG